MKTMYIIYKDDELYEVADNKFDVDHIIHEIDNYRVDLRVTAHMVVWEGRHDVPDAVDGPIFLASDSEYITDPDMLEEEALLKLREMQVTRLNLYITGLTIAVLAILNACKELGITVITWHYDRDFKNYYAYPMK